MVSNTPMSVGSALISDDFLYSLAIHPSEPSILYTASTSAHFDGGYDPRSQGVRYSDEEGKSWTTINNGMDWPFALALGLKCYAQFRFLIKLLIVPAR